MSASGVLNYSNVSGIIEMLVCSESRRHYYPDMDRDDLAQEIRTECLRVMPFFDAARIGPSPYKYFQTCVRNFLYNIKRGTYVPNNPPCVRCEFWDKRNKLCKINEEGCQKIIDYRKNMSLKASIKSPASLDIDLTDKDMYSNIPALILDESIRNKLPKHLIAAYENLITGEFTTSNERSQIRKVVREVIQDDE